MKDFQEKACCFTGHRQIPREDLPQLKAALRQAVAGCLEDGIRDFYAGGALGFDALGALCVLSFRAEYPDLRLHLYLPYPGYRRGWSKAQQDFQEKIDREAREIRYLSQLPPSPGYYRVTEAMYKRNRAMVEQSERCIVYCKKARGGSFYTLQYARKRGLRIEQLLPCALCTE